MKKPLSETPRTDDVRHNVAELAMRDPRYASDPAYREQVEKRMSVSSIF